MVPTNSKEKLTALAWDSIIYSMRLFSIEKTKELFPHYASQIDSYKANCEETPGNCLPATIQHLESASD